MADETPQTAERGDGYFSRALSAVLIGGATAFGLAHLLLGPLAGTGSDALGGDARVALSLIMLTTSLGQAIALYLRASHSGPDHVTLSVPFVARILPPVLTLVIVPVIYESELLDGGDAIILHALPVLAAAWSSWLMIGLLQKRILHALGIRVLPETLGNIIRGVQPAGLPQSFARVLAGAAAVASLLAISAVLTSVDSPTRYLADPRTALIGLSLVFIIGVAMSAGASLGQSPGRDVISIARRLDALGHNARDTMAWPIKVTSFDEVGVLFSELERLRERLAGELDVYQGALDRTREADEQKGQFLAAVSHELRTPLNSICGFAQLLLEGASGELTEPQAEDVRLIRTGGHQLLGLINDILDISMIESGELSLSFSEGSIDALLTEMVSIFQPLLRDKEFDLGIDIPGELPPVTCDRRRIGQVVTNLVTNAIKFTETGKITVRVTHDPTKDVILIRVIDTGVGIAPEELGTIFEEYKQVGSLKRRAKGTGLGLPIARSIVNHHGGSLTVESVLGEGSTFTLNLPVSPPRTPSSIDMAEEAARAVQRAQLRGDDLTMGGADA